MDTKQLKIYITNEKKTFSNLTIDGIAIDHDKNHFRFHIKSYNNKPYSMSVRSSNEPTFINSSIKNIQSIPDLFVWIKDYYYTFLKIANEK